jgi:hypothetical protein
VFSAHGGRRVNAAEWEALPIIQHITCFSIHLGSSEKD